MHPIFRLGGFDVPAYGLFLALGYLLGLLYLRRLARARGLPVEALNDFCFLGIVAALAGARLLFVLTNWEYYRAHPGLAPLLGGGGLVFYGGLLAAFPLSIFYLRWRRLPLGASLDVLAPALALGHGVGRLGCFFAGCCHGRLCELPWGMRFASTQVQEPLRGRPLHPTQLYEAAGLFVLAAGLGWLTKKGAAPAGRVAALYAVGYALLRLFTEYFRGDEIRGFVLNTGISTSQTLSLVLLLGGGGFLFRGLASGLARGFRSHH